jgi:pyruvate dehydrogenase E1 component alpha subunit
MAIMARPLAPALLLRLHRSMKRIRIVEERVAERYPEGRMRCPVHLCTGQEAVSAGVGAALAPRDLVVSTHRSHGHYLAKGGDLPRLIAEMHGKATGCSSGRGGSMHVVDEAAGFMGSNAILGSTIPVGTGLALAIQLAGEDRVSCVFLGDGATEEGVFYESVSFAALRRLPVLYVCENNLYSVMSPLAVRQPPGRVLHRVARCLGLAAEGGDGNDAVAVYRAARRAVARIRRGGGPVFLEFATYRWREHCGPLLDCGAGMRDEEEFRAWRERDPVARLEASLLAAGVLDRAALEATEAAIAGEIDEAFAFADASPFPDPAEASRAVFAGEGGAGG